MTSFVKCLELLAWYTLIDILTKRFLDAPDCWVPPAGCPVELTWLAWLAVTDSFAHCRAP
jgi:hypothetical protein